MLAYLAQMLPPAPRPLRPLHGLTPYQVIGVLSVHWALSGSIGPQRPMTWVLCPSHFQMQKQLQRGWVTLQGWQGQPCPTPAASAGLQPKDCATQSLTCGLGLCGSVGCYGLVSLPSSAWDSDLGPKQALDPHHAAEFGYQACSLWPGL